MWSGQVTIELASDGCELVALEQLCVTEDGHRGRDFFFADQASGVPAQRDAQELDHRRQNAHDELLFDVQQHSPHRLGRNLRVGFLQQVVVVLGQSKGRAFPELHVEEEDFPVCVARDQ